MSPPTINAPAGAVAQAENATATASTGPLDILALLQGNTVDNDNAAHPAPACTVHVGTARWGQNPKLAFDAIVAKMQHRSAVGPRTVRRCNNPAYLSVRFKTPVAAQGFVDAWRAAVPLGLESLELIYPAGF